MKHFVWAVCQFFTTLMQFKHFVRLQNWTDFATSDKVNDGFAAHASSASFSWWMWEVRDGEESTISSIVLSSIFLFLPYKSFDFSGFAYKSTKI